MTEKEHLLKQILSLEATASNLMAEATKRRKEVVKSFSPWLPGQFLRIKRSGVKTPDEVVKITSVKYYPDESVGRNLIAGQWEIRVEAWLSDLSRRAKNRGAWTLPSDTEFELIDNH